MCDFHESSCSNINSLSLIELKNTHTHTHTLWVSKLLLIIGSTTRAPISELV